VAWLARGAPKFSVEGKDCPTCIALERAGKEDRLDICVNDGEQDPGLPPEVERLEVLCSDKYRDRRILRCRDCGTFYRYSQRYEYSSNSPSYDEYHVYRVEDAVAKAVAPLFGSLAQDALDAALARAFRSDDEEVRKIAALVLESAPEKGGEDALRAAAEGLADRDSEVCVLCYNALVQALSGRGSARARIVLDVLAALGKQVYGVSTLSSLCQDELRTEPLQATSRAASSSPAASPPADVAPAAPSPVPAATAPAPAAPPPAPASAALPTEEELRGKPVADLEAELRRLISTCRMPPSAKRQFFESYELNTQLGDAAQRVNAQRTFLVNSILAYRGPEMQLTAEERMESSELIAMAMSRQFKEGSPVGADTMSRQNALGILLNEYEQGLSQEKYTSEDVDFHRRLALASFIRDNGADPVVLTSGGRG
jgi:hypothetical protein